MKCPSISECAVQLPETELNRQGYRYVAGIDEAGRGPLAGPVVAAAVILPAGWQHPEITDSKKLSASRRNRLFSTIKDHAIAWSWASCSPEEIDRINILNATFRAMKNAVSMLRVIPDYIIVDGSSTIPTRTPQSAIVKGDAKSLCIGAASIVAKVVRDSIMEKCHLLYPNYNFAQNKGYGTRQHIAAIGRYGACPLHRKSFRAAGGSKYRNLRLF
jgi:ribonuclease HII